jgi:ssDNA-binding Zn-finger/Zn-ribbon topoisomerase 1
MKDDDLIGEYEKATMHDNICDECNMPMKLIKGKTRKKYGKYNDYYKCDNCGNQFRRRTENEVLRDIGARD